MSGEVALTIYIGMIALMAIFAGITLGCKLGNDLYNALKELFYEWQYQRTTKRHSRND